MTHVAEAYSPPSGFQDYIGIIGSLLLSPNVAIRRHNV